MGSSGGGQVDDVFAVIHGLVLATSGPGGPRGLFFLAGSGRKTLSGPGVMQAASWIGCTEVTLGLLP